MVQLIPRGGLLRNAILFAGLLTCTASSAAAQELPRSTAFPGSFWISTGDVGPAEKDNVVTQAAFEQGITVWERSSWFAIPYLSAGFTADSAGYEWNDRHPFQVGMKLVRRVPGGALQAGGGLMFERDPNSGAERHPTAFVSYWAGWAAEGRAQRGSIFRGFPGHLSASSGLMTGRDPDNWMTRIDGHQGVAVLRNRVLSVVPYTAGVVTFDTKRRVWENRVTLDAGVKVVRPFVGGVVEAGVAERRQYTVLTDEVQTAPVVYVNLWVGWNPRTVSRR
jgi:opacity protein-like surface antigen